MPSLILLPLRSAIVTQPTKNNLVKSRTRDFQAFAWFSDLLVEHSELFWSLFGVDMDTVLSEQPPDT